MFLEHLFLIVKPIKKEMNIATKKIYFRARAVIGFLIKKTKTNRCKRGVLCLCSRCVIVADLKWILGESSGVRGRCKMQPCFLPGSGPSFFLQGPRFLSYPPFCVRNIFQNSSTFSIVSTVYPVIIA